MNIKRILTAVSSGFGAAVIFSGVAMAASTVVVTPSNPRGWYPADQRPNATYNYVTDSSAPGGAGALQLTTDTATAKIQYLHDTNTPLNSVTDLSYYTKQNSASFVGGDPSYQVVTCLNGFPDATVCNGFTTLVYEPYQNPAQGPVVPGAWQQWDVDQGLFWSSKTVTCSNGVIGGTAGGPATYTLAAIKSTCPEAVVVQYGVDVGSNNPAYNVETDLFNFNGTVYDFEPTVTVANKDACKNDGWKNSNSPVYKNQGDCVSDFASNGKAKSNSSVLSSISNAFSQLF